MRFVWSGGRGRERRGVGRSKSKDGLYDSARESYGFETPDRKGISANT